MQTTAVKTKKITGYSYNLDKLVKENRELKSAIKAITEGEIALTEGKTRTFKSFLKTRRFKHA